VIKSVDEMAVEIVTAVNIMSSLPSTSEKAVSSAVGISVEGDPNYHAVYSANFPPKLALDHTYALVISSFYIHFCALSISLFQ